MNMNGKGIPVEEETVAYVISRKLDELFRVCLDNNVPFFSTVALEEDNATRYISRTAAPVELGISLTDDRITKYIASLNDKFVLRIRKSEESTMSGDLFGDIIDEEY